MKHSKNKILYYILIFISFSFQNNNNDYELRIEWAKNNSLIISDKMQMNYISENNKTFYSKEKILKDEILFKIPHSIVLNIENALKLYGHKAKKLYDEFEPIFKEYKNNNFLCEQTFLSYMMYRVNKNNKTRNNNFYKYYKYLFNTFESNLDSFPLFYNKEQLYLIQFTSLAYSIDYIKKMYQGEIEILENDLKLKKINKDDYYVFRTYASSKSYNISGHSFIIPFVDMFNKHPTKFNIKVEAFQNETNVIATKDIYPLETLYIKYDTLTNQNALTLFGITFDELIDKISSFHVPILNPFLLKNRNIELKDSIYNQYFYQYMDIAEKEFYIKNIETYKNISFDLNKDKEELSALKLILENLESLQELKSLVTSSHIYNSFYQQKDIDNILRIYKGENKYMQEKINTMKEIINNKIEENKINKDL